MPTEPVSVVSWFIALEKLFDQLGSQLSYVLCCYVCILMIGQKHCLHGVT